MKRFNIISVFILFFTCLILTSCGGDITSGCKLNKEFEGKDFFTQGIGEARLATKTDGDTSGFTLINGGYVTVRYYGIDTPESTKDYQKWGKTASNFTNGKLENAYQIVLEATTTPASVDSYGTRYLAYVWYRNSAEEDFRNLNLEVVENGFSQNKLSQSDSLYYSYFKKAVDKAKKAKINIWSNDEDPLYSEEIIDVTVKDLNERTEELFNSCKFVRFEAYIKSSFDGYLAISNLIDGKEYNFIIYNNLSTPPSYMKIGNLVKFVGRVLMYQDEYQVTALNYQNLVSGDNMCSSVTQGYYLQFNGSTIKGNILDTITVSNAVVENGVLTITGTTKSENVDEVAVTLTYEVGTQTIDASAYVGKTITAIAYCNDGYKKAHTSITAKIININDINITK